MSLEPIENRRFASHGKPLFNNKIKNIIRINKETRKKETSLQ
jgi:hypothetical protein